MLCEKCGKNEAAIHYSENINGKKKTLALCRDCVPKNNLGVSILSGFFGGIGSDQSRIIPAKRTDFKKCPVCGISFDMIAATGMVGCSECYRVYKQELTPTIRRIHGDTVHKGISPDPHTGNEAEFEPNEAELRRKLDEAVANENYELAAILRDKIRSLFENK